MSVLALRPGAAAFPRAEVVRLSSRTATVLIVDDDASTRELLSTIAEEAGFRPCVAATAEDAMRAVRDDPPAVGIIDVMLPGMSGYEVCRALRDRFGETLPVIFVSGERVEPIDQVAGLLIGGDDYLVKPFAPDQLVARLRRCLARAAVYQEMHEPSPGVGLTPREREILQLLSDGLSQDAIATRLTISVSTVGTHIQRVLQKLGVHSRAEAVAAAYRDGLVGTSATAPAS